MLKSPRRTLIAVLLAGVIAACGPAPPGTQFWVQAQRQYEAGDYDDTLSYLNDVLAAGETDFSVRAAAWKVVILGAMTRAAIEFEEACAEGIYRVAEWESKPYKTCITQYRRHAKVRLLTLIDALTEFEKVASASDDVALDFPLPQAGSAVSAIVNHIKVGSMASDEVLEAAVARTIDRHFILQCQDAVGASEASRAVEMFESLPVAVPKAVFLVGISRTLVTGATVFEPGRLDDLRQRSLVLKRARESLKPALDGSGEVQSSAKALAGEIDKALRS